MVERATTDTHLGAEGSEEGDDPVVSSIPSPSDFEKKQWTAKEWAENILGRDHVQHSETKLKCRLEEFIAKATQEEYQMLENSRRKVLEAMHQAQHEASEKLKSDSPAETDRKFLARFKSGCKEAAEVAYEYTKLLDVVTNQAPEYVSAAYGAVKILLVMQINYEELKRNVREYMERIKTTFDMVDHLTVYIPTANLVNSVSQMYNLFNRFLAKALRLYTQSRARIYVQSLVRPWRRLEGIVDSIEYTYANVKDIAHFNSHIKAHASLKIGIENLAITQNLVALNENTRSVLQQLSDQVQGLSVRLTKGNDVQEVSVMLQQRVDERLENPCVDEKAEELQGYQDYTPKQPTVGDNIDLFLQDVFVELHSLHKETGRRRDAAEQLPERRDQRSRKRNVLRAENIMRWVESGKSELLWIDGSGILSRKDFNSLFAVPLLILGENSFESILLLRHFCGDGVTAHPNDYRTLLQSLLYQIFKQQPGLFEAWMTSMTREQAADLHYLWNLFLECLEKANADCTFIIMDSIDCLQSGEVRNGVSERDIILQQLQSLIADQNKRVKILLTASIAHNLSAESEGAISLYTKESLTNRHLSSSIKRSGSIFPENFVAIQERTCRSITFAYLSLLFPINSIIYSQFQGRLQAYVVCELSGMEHRFLNVYSPLQIRAFSVGYNGRQFCREYHTLSISQFPGEKDITSLKYTPSGYLFNEPERRAELIARGRKYWQLGSQIHYKQVTVGNTVSRVIIDNESYPIKSQTQDFGDEFPAVDHTQLKVRTLITCPGTIPAFHLHNREWTIVDVDRVQDLNFQPSPLDQLILSSDNKQALQSLVVSHFQFQDRASALIPSDEGFKDKEKGLLVWLHGQPGGGKTFTAACIAEDVQRPLVSIVAEVDGSSEGEQHNIAKILALAQRWKAIVLMEDADSILGQNSPDISATLWEIDHYGGVIFLTSRFGKLDPAIPPRLSYSVPYGTLSSDDRQKLWELLFNKALEEGFDFDSENPLRYAMDPSVESATRTGRDIQKAFTLAKQLSSLSGRTFKTSHLQSILQKRHNLNRYS